MEILHASVKNISDNLRNLLFLIEEIEDIELRIGPGADSEGDLLPRFHPELSPYFRGIEDELHQNIRQAWLSASVDIRGLAQDEIKALFEPADWDELQDPLEFPQDFNVVYKWLEDMGTLNSLQKDVNLQDALTRIPDIQEYLSTLLKLTQGWAVDITIKEGPGEDSDTTELFAEYSDSFMAHMTNGLKLIPYVRATYLMANFFLDNKEFIKPFPEPWVNLEKVSKISRGLIEGYCEYCEYLWYFKSR